MMKTRLTTIIDDYPLRSGISFLRWRGLDIKVTEVLMKSLVRFLVYFCLFRKESF